VAAVAGRLRAGPGFCYGDEATSCLGTEDEMATVKETFDMMAGRFKPDRAQGVKAQIQYDITGEGGGTYHADIADGACAVREGPAATPALTLTMTTQDWLDMLAGKLNGQVAFMTGKLKIKGDMGLAMRLAGMFGI
jgi:putative sterol carrier protein